MWARTSADSRRRGCGPRGTGRNCRSSWRERRPGSASAPRAGASAGGAWTSSAPPRSEVGWAPSRPPGAPAGTGRLASATRSGRRGTSARRATAASSFCGLVAGPVVSTSLRGATTWRSGCGSGSGWLGSGRRTSPPSGSCSAWRGGGCGCWRGRRRWSRGREVTTSSSRRRCAPRRRGRRGTRRRGSKRWREGLQGPRRKPRR
mmetsp:Transcript_101189/g.263853  ORF Transcript_101189/g.263853 Transcript_101189/m.263853 type:complete len:204 (+) Transcript_101189:205-816(+)